MPRPLTLRALARRLRLSVATVSEALRDCPRVNVDTRARVKAAARRHGYQPNPLLGAALSAVRRSRQQSYRGVLALIDTDETDPALYLTFHRAVAAGAQARAEQLGFQTAWFWLGQRPPALPPRRLSQVLRARGIAGAVLLPFHTAQDLSDFDFSQLAAVQMDHCLVRPHLHTVLPDHFVSMTDTLEQLTNRDYRRIGLCLEQRKDERVKHKWSAAFLSFFRSRGLEPLPPLLVRKLTPELFAPWYDLHRPDAIVGHVQDIVAWLAQRGRHVPADVGFFNLNITEQSGPCAGLDLGPQRLGAAAIESVVAMLHRHEAGVPPYPKTITLAGTWVDGPTLRPPVVSAAF